MSFDVLSIIVYVFINYYLGMDQHYKFRLQMRCYFLLDIVRLDYYCNFFFGIAFQFHMILNTQAKKTTNARLNKN